MESLAQYSAALGYPYSYPRPPYAHAFSPFPPPPPPPPGLAYGGGAGAAGGGGFPPMLPLGAFAGYGVLPPPPPPYPPAAAVALQPGRQPQQPQLQEAAQRKKSGDSATSAASCDPPGGVQMKADKSDRIDRLATKTERVFVPPSESPPSAAINTGLDVEDMEQSLYHRQLQEAVLIEKKLSLLQSEDVMKFLQKRQEKLGQKTRASELFINRMKHSPC